MSDRASPPVLPQPLIRQARKLPVIWVIPLVALAIGAWLAWDTLSKEGPTIKSSFESGEGLQAGQSQLKYKDIVFGTVKNLELSPDQTHVVVTVATTRQAEPLLTEGNVVLGRQAAAVRRQYFRPRDPALGLLYRHAAGADRPARAQRDVYRARGPACPRSQRPGAHFLAQSRAARMRFRSARRCFSAISMSVKCSAGTSPTWRST